MDIKNLLRHQGDGWDEEVNQKFTTLSSASEGMYFSPQTESLARPIIVNAAYFLRAEGFGEGFRKGCPSPPKTSGIPATPLWANLAKSSGARRGIAGENPVVEFNSTSPTKPALPAQSNPEFGFWSIRVGCDDLTPGRQTCHRRRNWSG
ncbi:hypothetical protein EDE11_102203 [Methylomonas methanica]|uniref:Uncharacterized protein n=1 Tax=Methylomonas methanica TaxID=421 RepID=A0ABY2CS79_METMH|nr:hypothetical protein EDE11_102203 [Methylomonas methanica]